MRWEDERYIRLYTRDTVDWNMWPWQGRALFPLLLRKVDRAGILDLGKHGARGLSEMVKLPVEVVEAGLAALLDDGCVELRGAVLVICSFIEAQECAATDAQRKRDERERARARTELAKLESVTKRDDESQNVTKCHDQSQAVTSSHSVPICAVPSEKGLSADADPVDSKSKKEPDAQPLPFSIDAALDALVAGGRFVKSKITKGQAINITRLIRENPELVTWTLVGQWLQAGGESWKQEIDVRALKDFSAWAGHAKRWDESGRRPIAKNGTTPGPTKPVQRPIEWKPPEVKAELPSDDVREALRKVTK